MFKRFDRLTPRFGLALLLSLSLSAEVWAKLPYADMDYRHPQSQQATILHERKIMRGVSDTRFGGELALTRFQYAEILNTLLGDKDVPNTVIVIISDVQPGSASFDAVSRVTRAGIIEMESGTFNGTKPVSRYEFASSLVRLLQFMAVPAPVQRSKKIEFKDVDDSNKESVDQIANIWQLIEGDGSGKFNGKSDITRYEALAMVSKASSLLFDDVRVALARPMPTPELTELINTNITPSSIPVTGPPLVLPSATPTPNALQELENSLNGGKPTPTPVPVKPSVAPTAKPSIVPSAKPTPPKPTAIPTAKPTTKPTVVPTPVKPTAKPPVKPTAKPSAPPIKPSAPPAVKPSAANVNQAIENAIFGSPPPVKPSTAPSQAATPKPTASSATQANSVDALLGLPSAKPTPKPAQPSAKPPSTKPGDSLADLEAALQARPSAAPSGKPPVQPSAKPSSAAQASSVDALLGLPSPKPSAKPSPAPTAKPNVNQANSVDALLALPSAAPSLKPSQPPAPKPSLAPSAKPTAKPSLKPTPKPTPKPPLKPTPKPTAKPTAKPTPTPKPSQQAAKPPVPAVKPTPKPQDILTDLLAVTPTPAKSASPVPSRKPLDFVPAAPESLVDVPLPVGSVKPSAQPTPSPTPKPEGMGIQGVRITPDPDQSAATGASPAVGTPSASAPTGSLPPLRSRILLLWNYKLIQEERVPTSIKDELRMPDDKQTFAGNAALSVQAEYQQWFDKLGFHVGLSTLGGLGTYENSEVTDLIMATVGADYKLVSMGPFELAAGLEGFFRYTESSNDPRTNYFQAAKTYMGAGARLQTAYRIWDPLTFELSVAPHYVLQDLANIQLNAVPLNRFDVWINALFHWDLFKIGASDVSLDFGYQGMMLFSIGSEASQVHHALLVGAGYHF